LGSVVTGDMSHAGFYQISRPAGIPAGPGSHTVWKICVLYSVVSRRTMKRG